MVLNANNASLSTKITSKEEEGICEGYLSTGALRFRVVYGTPDPVTIPGCLLALQKDQTNLQLGDGKNM